jgi:hypothetical protein
MEDEIVVDDLAAEPRTANPEPMLGAAAASLGRALALSAGV